MFVSVRGFPAFQLEKGIGDVQELLEAILDHADRACVDFGGEIDKVIEEKVLILFEHNRLGGAAQAARAAIRAFHSIREGLRNRGFVLPLASGITSGPVLSGILGAPSFRLDLTVIGDPVNLAARLLGIALQNDQEVVISGRIKDVLGEEIRTLTMPVKSVRGKTQEVEVLSFLAWAADRPSKP